MRWLSYLLFLGITTELCAAARQGSVQFRNGDRFRGTFIGFDAKKGFGWTHNDIRGDLWIEAAAVSRLQFNAAAGDGARAHSARGALMPVPASYSASGSPDLRWRQICLRWSAGG